MTVPPAPPCLTAESLAVAGVQHGFYGRRGGVSVGEFGSLNCSVFSGDKLAAVAANRRRVADDLGATSLFTNKQIHGKSVRVIETGDDPDEVIEADGMVTAETSLCLGVLAADCAPVLFADSQARVIGVAHAGWQGALAGVCEAVIATMQQLGARTDDMACAVGPAIGAASYQVGDEFVARLRAESPVACEKCFRYSKTGEVYFDLPGYVAKRIAGAGIAACEVLTADTFADESRFFSYRRSCHRGETNYGRQLSAIVLT